MAERQVKFVLEAALPAAKAALPDGKAALPDGGFYFNSRDRRR